MTNEKGLEEELCPTPNIKRSLLTDVNQFRPHRCFHSALWTSVEFGKKKKNLHLRVLHLTVRKPEIIGENTAAFWYCGEYLHLCQTSKLLHRKSTHVNTFNVFFMLLQ